MNLPEANIYTRLSLREVFAEGAGWLYRSKGGLLDQMGEHIIGQLWAV